MKVLKFLMAISVIAVFASSNAVAQNVKHEWTITQYFEGTAYCGTEKVIGTVTREFKLWENNKIQVKTTWPLIGQTSDASYEAQAIMNDRLRDMPE